MIKTTSFNILRSAVLTAVLVFQGYSASAALSVDVNNRENTRIFYNAIYPASEGVASGWTGNTSTGAAGSTSSAFKNAIFLRINYFRAMAGLSSTIGQNASWNTSCQQSALMMAANNTLSHDPNSSWKFYTSSGATAAANSNLALGYNGSGSISSYMEDPGSNNTAVGHRRWIFYPQTKFMGTGDVGVTGNNQPANSLWIMDTVNFALPRPTVRDTFVAWPPKGYVPYNLIYPRWSFSYPGGDFSAATVSLKRNGTTLSVKKEAIANGYGENTLVFIPDNLNPNAWAGPVKPATDTTTTVTIGNVKVAGVAKSFTYNVISFDPAKTGTGSVTTVITGSASPKAFANNAYTVNALPLATGYQWKYGNRTALTTLEGAEISGTVTTSVQSGYSFRTTDVKYAGTYSYHLTNANFTSASFTLKETIIPKTGATLKFNSRLGYATNYQTAKVQVSQDGGVSWLTTWSQAGSNSAGESAFATRTISLAAYVNKEIMVRFLFDLIPGSTYTQTTTGVGWYLDNITFANTDQFTNIVTSAVSTTQNFNFVPKAAGSYWMEVREQVYGQYYLSWSGGRMVTAVN